MRLYLQQRHLLSQKNRTFALNYIVYTMNKIYRRWLTLSDEQRHKYQSFIYAAFLIVSVAIVYLSMPHSARFNLEYEIGKPWHYDILTAEEDIPIYHTETDIKRIRDSLMRYYQPYYNIDYSARDKAHEYVDKNRNNLSDIEYKTVLSLIDDIYTQGILNNKTYENYLQKGVKQLLIIDTNSVISRRNTIEIYSSTSAFENLRTQCAAAGINKDKINLDHCIYENITLDKEKTESFNKELMSVKSETGEKIQKGESIINRGDIVTLESYRKLESLRKFYNDPAYGDHGDDVPLWITLGRLLLITGLLFFFGTYVYLFRIRYFESIRSMAYFMVVIVAMIVLSSLVLSLTTLGPYVIPFALLPIMVRAFFDSRTALYAHIITILIVSMMVELPYLFVTTQIIVGMLAVSSMKQMTRRSQLVTTALAVFLAYSMSYIAFCLVTENSLQGIHLQMFIKFLASSILLFFAYVLIFIFEKIFGFLSDVTLVELSNINSKLLMELSTEAPGSFQHVLQVANLAASCAAAIDANVLLTRTGALYHDIGKKSNPLLYTENQAGGENALNKLPLDEAAQVIISHVTEGVKIARKGGLPQQIIRFIQTHHAKSKTKYFYFTYKNQFPDAEIDESKFTYPGPLPKSKEEVLVMMADAIEAASRSLKYYNSETISELVNKIINSQIEEGSFANADITFSEVETVKEILKERLLSMYHTRISYPELKKTETTEESTTPTEEKNQQ